MSDEGYFVRIDETLVGRRAGGSAAERANELRAQRPVRSALDRFRGKKTDERAWRKGARGANIDHVVVGPAGVFTVNAKNVSRSC